MTFRRIVHLAAAVIFCQFLPDTYAADTLWFAQIMRPKNIEKRIKFLKWDDSKFSIVLDPDERNTFIVRLSGKFQKKDWKLIISQERSDVAVSPDKAGKFTLELKVTKSQTSIQLHALGPLGEDISEENRMMIKDWGSLMQPLEEGQSSGSLFTLIPSLGPSIITYTEGDEQKIRMVTTTAAVLANYRILPPSVDLGASLFLNVLPITSSTPDTSVRYLGANIRVGYAPWFIPRPLRLSLMFGLYYNQMFVADNVFGYTPLFFPQFYPLLSYTLKSGHTISAYFKYAPLTEGFSLFSLDEREIAFGGTFGLRLANGHILTLGIDYSDLTFNLTESKISTTTSLTFRVGYSLF